MKVFSGFPSGKLQVTPLPDLFFAEVCPEIDDLAELKLTLHVIWLLAQRARGARSSDGKGRPLYVRAAELAVDRTLVRSLGHAEGPAQGTLGRALAAALGRGTLLHLRHADEDFYFLNSESGRLARTRLEQSEQKAGRRAAPRESAPPDARPNIFVLYEQNIGLLTPMLSEELKEAEQQYPAAWIPEAFKVAVENNKRSWSYIRKILERWKTEGRSEHSKKGKTWYSDEYSKFVKR